ncbi:MAG: hypothetical protein ACK4FE_02660 [Azonexus sp.]
MRKIFASMVLLVAVADVFACSVGAYSTSDKVLRSIQKYGFSFNNYEEICKKLNDSNAELVISGSATVLAGNSIGWAAIGLKDKRAMVFTNSYGGLATQINGYASQDKAEELLAMAINEAINNTGFNKALSALDESRKQAKMIVK